MSLKVRIQEDVKNAMRAQRREHLAVLRLVTAAIKQKEVDERIDLDDAQVLAVLDKMAKQRRESLEQYRAAGRDDLADQEQFELDLIQTYLPEQLGQDELAALIRATIAELPMPSKGKRRPFLPNGRVGMDFAVLGESAARLPVPAASAAGPAAVARPAGAHPVRASARDPVRIDRRASQPSPASTAISELLPAALLLCTITARGRSSLREHAAR